MVGFVLSVVEFLLPIWEETTMDKPTISLHGVFLPILTPFDVQGEVDYGALTANLERWNA